MEPGSDHKDNYFFNPSGVGYNSAAGPDRPTGAGYNGVSGSGNPAGAAYNSAAGPGNPAGAGYSGVSGSGNPAGAGYSGVSGSGNPAGAGYRGAPGAAYGGGYHNPSGAGYHGAAGAGYSGAYGPGSPAGAGYMDPPPRTPSSVQAEIKGTRHKKEVPLYITMIVLGVLACTIIILHDISGDGFMSELRKLFEDMPGMGPSDISRLISVVFFATSIIFGIGSLLLLFITTLVGVYRLYADQMSYSIRVSERNFPEIYAKVREYTWLLGWKKEPEVYVQQMGGAINAFTSWVPGKVFVQLNAEVVDLAYMEHKDFETINFIMAHEFGHAHLHHVQLYYAIWPLLVTFIPFIGPNILHSLLSRSREYSCDRVAQALTGGVAQEECMMMLSAGRHAYKYVNSREYIRDITARHNAVERFARWCVNLFASHPIMPYRVNAILDPTKKSGRLL